MTSTDHESGVEGLVRSLIETRARGVTPNPSPRTEPTSSCWLGAGRRERKVQGLSLIKSRPLGCSAVAAPERDQRYSDTSWIAGEREDAEGGDAGMG